jgi:catechol 2,3-dioxygenase-like lactoylglutathione lyase family enzyme
MSAGQPGATRITAVGTVLVTVSDQERALEFYVNTLGFEKRLDGPSPAGRWIEVAPPGAATTIALVTAQADDARVSLATRDAAADHARLRAQGADADAEVMRMGHGVPPMFSVRDPDGNVIRVVERP